ncbi:hypothetical protein Hanom_Chr05g00465861 [Helianthus anomalus]
MHKYINIYIYRGFSITKSHSLARCWTTTRPPEIYNSNQKKINHPAHLQDTTKKIISPSNQSSEQKRWTNLHC